jgi:hypothetical protein
MNERKTELLAVLESADRETRELLESLTDEDLTKQSGESNWTVGQLAGHIAQVPWAIYVTRRLAAGKNATSPAPFGFLLHLGNWWNVRRFKTTSCSELLQTWSTGIEKYRAHVDSIPESTLDNGGEVSGRGRMTVYEFVKTAPAHTREHAETIRRAVR